MLTNYSAVNIISILFAVLLGPPTAGQYKAVNLRLRDYPRSSHGDSLGLGKPCAAMVLTARCNIHG